jgi:Right handed beta helix region
MPTPAAPTPRSPRRRRTWIGVSLAVLAAAVAAAVVVTSGNGPSGPPVKPWRSLSSALAGAKPGDTIVLPSGTYGRPGVLTRIDVSGAPGAPITIKGPTSGPPVDFVGATRINGSHLVFANLHFKGPTGPVLPRTSDNPGGEEVLVAVYGDNVSLRHDEVSGDHWHAGVYVAGAQDLRITGSFIHDNGDRSDPAQANLDHGIYWADGSGIVANDLIEHNLAFGVHLYPSAGPVTVANNTIVANGRSGVIVSAHSFHCVVVNNIVFGNVQNGIRSSSDLAGNGNAVLGNLLWANGERNFGTDLTGLAVSGNVTADPRFAGPRDFRLRAGSPAVGRALAQYAPRDDILGRPRPRGQADLGAFESG